MELYGGEGEAGFSCTGTGRLCIWDPVPAFGGESHFSNPMVLKSCKAGT